MTNTGRTKDKPTTPRLPSGATWGTCLLILGFFLFSSIGYFAYDALNSSALSGNLTGALPAGSPAQEPQAATAESQRSGHGILQRPHSALVSTPKTTEPAQNPLQLAEQAASAPSEAILQAALTPSDAKDTPQPKLSPDLEAIDPNANVNVIVQFKDALKEENLDLVRAQGGNHLASFHLIHAASFALQGRALKALAARDQIGYITPDRRVTGALDNTAAAVNAQTAWTSGYTGSGISIAVIDSGVTYLSDLDWDDRVVYSQSFVPNDSSTSDAYGHGTHVAGIAAGNGNNSTGSSYSRTFKGIAPKAKIINLRVLDQNGVGSDSAVISAIQRAIALKSSYNIRVINLSLGRQVFESYKLDPLCQAVEQAWQAGIVVVVAAGNQGRNNSAGTNGYGTIAAPGNDPFVITVGAMNTMGTPSRTDDVITSYSSKGPSAFDQIVKPDLVAPGNRVVSLYAPGEQLASLYPLNAVPTSFYITGGNFSYSSTYFTLSGTSMATPVVSGAAALLLQQNSSLTPDQVKARLMKTAYKSFPTTSSWTDPLTNITYTSQYDIFTVGAGYLDIAAALANSDLAAAPATSPSAVYNAITGRVSLLQASGVVWGSSVAWGSSVVWGTSVIWGNSVVWGTNNTEINGTAVLWGNSVCWGTSTANGFSVIWGTGVVWGSNSTSSDTSMMLRVAALGDK